MSAGPSSHLSWNELACINRLGRPWNGFAPGEIIAEYPDDWRNDRALRLAETFEHIRSACGNLPLFVNSAYRTSGYNRAVGGARSSQHVYGRAVDFHHPKIKAADLFLIIRHMEKAGKLPHLGGIGSYSTFVHIDVRPRRNNRLAVWFGNVEGT